LTAGVAKFGGSSVDHPKTSFRLYFEEEWGPERLKYPLFEGYGQGTIEPVASFDKLELRSQSWDGRYARYDTTNGPDYDYGYDYYVSDRWWKDTVLELGSLSPHGRYVNVFMNGQFHGVYDLRERFDSQWFSSYGSGETADYDQVKYDGYAGWLKVSQGSDATWNTVVNASTYAEVRDLINRKALIHHELVDSLTVNVDKGEREYRIIGARDSAHADDLIIMHNDNDMAFGNPDSDWWEWNPAGPSDHEFGLVHRFKNDPEFLQEVWDQTAFAFCGSGPLTVQASLARLNRLAAEVELAMEGDIARWGQTSYYSAIDYARNQITSGMPALKAGWEAEGLFNGCDRRPAVEIPPNQISLANVLSDYPIQAIDPDGDAISYASTTLPPGLSIDSNTGLISGVPSTPGTYQVALTIGDSRDKWGIYEFEWEILPATGNDSPLILNEYNAVDLDAGTGFAGSDPAFPGDPKIGGDWLELALVADADLRGWSVELWDRDRKSERLEKTDTFVFADDPLFTNLEAGAILTLAEDVADDPLFDPRVGDWSINLQSNSALEGAYITSASQSNFDTTRRDFRIIIRNKSGQAVGQIMGETEAWKAAQGNVGAEEVMALCTTPSETIRVRDDYADEGMTSTFGKLNICDGFEQDFSSLRMMLGDVSCDKQVTVIDALLIMQFDAQMRTDAGSCPLDDGATQLYLKAGDVNADGFVDVVDALFVMQCDVEISNVFCP